MEAVTTHKQRYLLVTASIHAHNSENFQLALSQHPDNVKQRKWLVKASDNITAKYRMLFLREKKDAKPKNSSIKKQDQQVDLAPVSSPLSIRKEQSVLD